MAERPERDVPVRFDQVMIPPQRRTTLTKRAKVILTVVVVLTLGFLGLIALLGTDPFFILQANSIRKAGTWENDPKNWHRAFDEEPPAGVKVSAQLSM